MQFWILKEATAPLIKRLLHLDIVSIDLSYGPETAGTDRLAYRTCFASRVRPFVAGG